MKEIILENICKVYGKNEIIKNLNFSIKPGEKIILLGASGCGKSTTLRMVAGLDDISSGNLYMDGQRVNDIVSGKRDISMVFQNYALYPHMTVADNICYGLKIQKLTDLEIKSRLQAVVKMLELYGLEDRKPKDLSGGQRQRVALARAVVKRSGVLLLDEPLSNLDAQLRVHARKELMKIHQAYSQTFIYVTHDQVEAMTLADRVAVLNKGRLEVIDTPQNVYNNPANVFTAKFIGSPGSNIWPAHYQDGYVHIGKQKVKLPEFWNAYIGQKNQREFYLGIRPEHMKIYHEQKNNTFIGIIKYIETYGNQCGVYFMVEGCEGIILCDNFSLKPGQKIYFSLDSKKIHLFSKKNENNIGYPEAYYDNLYKYQSV
ncbi:ABC transporter ATP-binding protein [Pectinatus brassicae]|uniref:ABC-type sugar transport system ATPase subunit n=1 Tax=Pectinatus brassicae TaxID=862415 RepID=A0A840UTM5_9FIRM|nr:ABC transporter ATP-binding protein [Pectinatus brassicae]MBB5337482.1 ABC-type sugar transport system ATPase subunit [Pectinatus brassicae]